MPKDYSYQGEDLFFKHEISHNLSKDAYSMHSHNTYELLYFVSGDATHVIEDRKYKLKRGDLVLIRPSKYHFIIYQVRNLVQNHVINGVFRIPHYVAGKIQGFL